MIDVSPLLEKLDSMGSVLEGKELLLLASFLRGVNVWKKQFERLSRQFPSLAAAFSGFIPLPELAKLIRSRIDDEGEVREDASPELKKLHARAAAAESRVQKAIQGLIRRLGPQKALQENFFTLRGDRYVLPVRAGAKSRVKGIVHDVSGTGETLFIEPLEIVELTNQLSTVRIGIRDEIRRILASVTDTVRCEMSSLEENARLAGNLDFLRAEARFCHEHRFSIPEIGPGGTLQLMKAHHPLIYLKDKDSSVPISLRLEEGNRVLVISGPNAGGKTTTLKTIGLLSMMAQSGLAVPAFTDTRFPLFQKWFVDIGDAQDVTEGVSTFSAHIRNIARILREAGEKSLVLLDELGTATDPTEGGALAVSILEKIAERAGLTIATSHLSPLKAWAHDFPAARNASFRLDEKTHQPTFHILLDVPGASEAFLIAEREGLPEGIMKRAAGLLPKGEADLSQLIASLHRREKEIEANREEIKNLLKEQKILRSRILELQDFLRQKERRLEEDMLAEKETLLREAREFVEKQIAEFPSRRRASEARKQISRELESVQKEKKAAQKIQTKPVDPDRFREGMSAIVTALNESGEIRSIDRVRMQATLFVKGMVVTAPLSGLKIPEKEESATERGTRVSFQRKADMNFELDLHGMRVEEMLPVVERFLNDALLADLPYVRLVHGIGTGALRRALHDYLRTMPFIREYRYGGPEEGGGGVTIVQFA